MSNYRKGNSYHGRHSHRRNHRSRGRFPDDDNLANDMSPTRSGCFPGRNAKYAVDSASRHHSQNGSRRRFLEQIGLPIRSFGGRKRVNEGKAFHAVNSAPGRVDKTWNKIVIPRGQEFGKQFIFDSLSTYIDTPIYPILFRWTENGDAMFYLEDDDQAEAARSVSRRIQAPNGFKLVFHVHTTAMPFVPVTSEEHDILMQVLNTRYDSESQALNLSTFNQDQTIQRLSKGGFLSLQRNAVMMDVISIVGKGCPYITAIDLSHNRLRTLDYFACLVPRTPHVVLLNLTHNQIDKEIELERLSGWNLQSLDLDMNPICTQFRDKAVYVSAMRKIFPKIIKLDGVDLPAPIGFDLEVPLAAAGAKPLLALPPFRPSFFAADLYKNIVTQLVESYYSIYDSDDRESLFNVYHEDATLTMTCYTLGFSNRMAAAQADTWRSLVLDSHNVCNTHLWERHRQKLVHRGRLGIVNYLSSLPKTRHDPASFILDVAFASDQLIIFNVSGLYRERSESDETVVRYFNKNWVAVPRENGTVAIVNEMLFYSLMTSEMVESYMSQLDRAHKFEAAPAVPMASTSHMAVPSQPLVPAPIESIIPDAMTAAVASLKVDDSLTDQRQMVIKFAQETGMKPEWAEKCIIENEYSYPKALHVFSELKKLGVIPVEAFMQ